MTTVEDDWSRLAKPFHVRCWEILRCRTIDAAKSVIAGEARSCSTNFLLAQVPTAWWMWRPRRTDQLLGCDSAGCLTHANHFVDPEGLGIVEAPNDRRIFSQIVRSVCGSCFMPPSLTVEGIQESLRDRQDDPFGICRHRNPAEPPEMHYTTVTAVVMDLFTRTLHLTDGPPDTAPFQTVSLLCHRLDVSSCVKIRRCPYKSQPPLF
jgi:isopenicillin-N N-acyltransferase-like protein